MTCMIEVDLDTEKELSFDTSCRMISQLKPINDIRVIIRVVQATLFAQKEIVINYEGQK